MVFKHQLGMGWQKGLLASVLGLHLLATSFASMMDPHVFPSTGPFIEGWYLRIIDYNQNISLGFMFGRVLPSTTLPFDDNNSCEVPELQTLDTDCRRTLQKQADVHFSESSENDKPHLVFVGLLLGLDQHEPLHNPGGYFSSCQYNMTVDGKPVSRNPIEKGPAHFEIRISHNFSLLVSSNGSKFSVMLGNHIFTGETEGPVSWGSEGEGPEGWLSKLPLPFHWFVYSLRSTVKHYQYVNKETGLVINGSSDQDVPVVAHMEKNWGSGFPKAWIWSQGVDSRNEVSYVFSAGLVNIVALDIRAQLSGYRNSQKQISCNFSPANSFHSLHFDGCAGTAILKVQSLTCAVTFQVSAASESFSSCLSAPMAEGFKGNCVESFAAIANITVYQLHGFSMVLTDNQIIILSALEFGGAFMCNGKCPDE